MSSYYGWRDMGTGVRARDSGIGIIGNFNYMNEAPKTSAEIAKEYCSNCHVKLVYNKLIKKWMCPEHGCNLTQEESDILLGKAPKSPPATTVANNVPIGSDIDTGGLSGGFIPMQRAGNTDVIGRQEEGNGEGYTIAIPSRKSKDEGKYRTPSGDFITMDADRQKLVDKGYTILEATDILPESIGHTNVMGTYNSAEKLREFQREKQLEQRYDNRYEGHNGGGLQV